MGCLDRGAAAIYVILFEIFGQNLIPPLIIFSGVFGDGLFQVLDHKHTLVDL